MRYRCHISFNEETINKINNFKKMSLKPFLNL